MDVHSWELRLAVRAVELGWACCGDCSFAGFLEHPSAAREERRDAHPSGHDKDGPEKDMAGNQCCCTSARCSQSGAAGCAAIGHRPLRTCQASAVVLETMTSLDAPPLTPKQTIPFIHCSSLDSHTTHCGNTVRDHGRYTCCLARASWRRNPSTAKGASPQRASCCEERCISIAADLGASGRAAEDPKRDREGSAQ